MEAESKRVNPCTPYFCNVATRSEPFAPAETNPQPSRNRTVLSSPWHGEIPQRGLLVINADDWGRDRETTERTLECLRRGVVSSVSAMVFMQDSERAAGTAREQDIDAGLHLNLTTPFSGANCPARFAQHQQRIARCLRRYRLAQAVFHPTLMRSFEYVVSAQLEEFCRLYGRTPERFDGHHHMHLCANVLLGRLLPPVTVVRRNFSFEPGEKSLANRLYRRAIDRILARRHRLTDFFFSLEQCLKGNRLGRVVELSRVANVELMTHPEKTPEFEWLMGDEFPAILRGLRLGDYSAL